MHAHTHAYTTYARPNYFIEMLPVSLDQKQQTDALQFYFLIILLPFKNWEILL